MTTVLTRSILSSFSQQVIYVAFVLLFVGPIESASGVAVNGAIGFQGSGSIQTSGTTSSLSFTSPLLVDLRVADYNGIPVGTTSNFSPITWTGSNNNAVLTSNNLPEWTIISGGTTYQYAITSLTSAIASSAQGSFSLSGMGVATINGALNREPTYIPFSVQGLLDADGNSPNLTFQLVTTCGLNCGAQLVPDRSATVVLLALALIAVGILRRYNPVN